MCDYSRVTEQRLPIAHVVQLLPLILDGDTLFEVNEGLVHLAPQLGDAAGEQQEERTLNANRQSTTIKHNP